MKYKYLKKPRGARVAISFVGDFDKLKYYVLTKDNYKKFNPERSGVSLNRQHIRIIDQNFGKDRECIVALTWPNAYIVTFHEQGPRHLLIEVKRNPNFIEIDDDFGIWGGDPIPYEGAVLTPEIIEAAMKKAMEK